MVVLADDLIANPEGMLRAMCSHAGLPFDSAMLRWPAGPKPYDGVWASYWYRSVHQSTGTTPASTSASSPKHTQYDALLTHSG